MATERLQKVLAAAGITSRRGAEAMIAAGRVTVDGKRATPGTQVDPERAIVAVDGQVIGAAAAQAYLLLHKPGGVTSTTRDRHATTTVMDLIPTALVPDGARLYPVGRLDQDSEGLLVLTNDGGWADRVLHPRHGVEREYALALSVPLEGEQVDALRAGIPLDEGLATLGGLRPDDERRNGPVVGAAAPDAVGGSGLVSGDVDPGLEAPAPAHVRGRRGPGAASCSRSDRPGSDRWPAQWRGPPAQGARGPWSGGGGGSIARGSAADRLATPTRRRRRPSPGRHRPRRPAPPAKPPQSR